MKNLFNISKKIKSLLFAEIVLNEKNEVALKDICYNYVIVVDGKTGKPQSFCLNDPKDRELYGLGVFVDAYPEVHGFLSKEFPVEIFDQETALYLIGQSAVFETLSVDAYQERINKQPILRTVPVFGGMIPDCLTLNPAK